MKRLILLIGLMAVPARVLSGDEGTSPLVVHSIQQYWELAPEVRQTHVAYELECLVTFFDPEWKMLFVEDSTGLPAYFTIGPGTFPFRFGQHLRLSGITGPTDSGISLASASITELPAREITPAPLNFRTFDNKLSGGRFVAGTGFVDHLRRLDATHLELNLSMEGKAVHAWVLVDPSKPIPNFLGTRIRFDAVYNLKLGLNGILESFELLVPSVSHVEILGRLADDPGFALKPVPIGEVSHKPVSEEIKVRGRVRAQDPGHFVRIRDATGQIDVQSAQTQIYSINDLVEAHGYPEIHGTDWKLSASLHRLSTDSIETTRHMGESELRLAGDVLEIPPDLAEKGIKVHLEAVVTWSHPDSPFFFVQDSSAGICVSRAGSTSQLRAPGRVVDLRGVTHMGPYAPEVAATTFDKTGETSLPVARQISLEHALTGAEEAQWVEMRGYVSGIERVGALDHLQLVTNSGNFEAVVAGAEDLGGFLGALVRVDGVCTAVADTTRKLNGIRIWVPSASYIQVQEAAPADPFTVPLYPIGKLGQFGTLQELNRRVRLEGTVSFASQGEFFYLTDGDQSVRVLARSREFVEPGTKLEVVGLLGRHNNRVLLREAVFRISGKGSLADPVALKPQTGTREELDGRIVSVEASLLQATQAGAAFRCLLGSGGEIFEAIGNGARFSEGRTYAVESRLKVTGLYQVNRNETGAATGYKILLRDASDLEVLATPSWFNRERILGFATVLTGGILAVLTWVLALRRRVQKQTVRIREQLNREAYLESELQRHSKLESLGFLAGGIAHDFNNLLTVMLGNLSLARLAPSLDEDTSNSLEEAEKAAHRAKDLTMQLLTFSRGGAPTRGAVSVPDVIREVAEFTLRGSSVKCSYDIPGEIWAANADRGQVAQVVQNVAINALQAMSSGGTLAISVRNDELGDEYAPVLTAGRYVRIVFSDTGPGISQKDLHHVFDPYFTTKKDGSGLGLATVYSIVKRHDGHITVSSVVGQGTTITVWLPCAPSGQTVGSTSEPVIQAASPVAPGRILVMDDDPGVLQVAVAILHRFKHRVTAVKDGEEAVNEYLHALHVGEPYDLVILDLTVPGGLGGKPALDRLRVLDPQIKAIVSSGYSNDTILANFVDHGFLGRVSKPYVVEVLAAEVDRLLRKTP